MRPATRVSLGFAVGTAVERESSPARDDGMPIPSSAVAGAVAATSEARTIAPPAVTAAARVPAEYLVEPPSASSNHRAMRASSLVVVTLDQSRKAGEHQIFCSLSQASRRTAGARGWS